MIKQGIRVKILKGDFAGLTGTVIAKAPGAGSAPIWMVSVPGKAQARVEEKDLQPAS
jgi:hypothetical protein